MEGLLVATSNPGKLKEIRRVLAGLAEPVIGLEDLPPPLASLEPPEETGATFLENAVLKAAYYGRIAGRLTVAEDSGLAIDALGGAPGILSARYPGATYPEKFENLYRALAGHARPWTARFVCGLAVVAPTEDGTSPHVVFTCEAAVEGELSPHPRGTYGFGYDPAFYYPPANRTFGELTDEEKLAVSHRGQAFRKLRRWMDAAPLFGAHRL